MQNIATIYRFNTPFLDIQKEKYLLIGVKEKIKTFLENQGFSLKISTNTTGNYNDVFFETENILKIQFKYIKEFRGSYYMPIFKMDIFLHTNFLVSNESLKKTTLFLTSLFECFDGLNEKEYLLDMSETIYYKTGVFGKKIYPNYDFQNISLIQKQFESKKGNKLLEEFIKKFQNNDFILTKENSQIYHKIHAIILYYIYLVYLMHKTIQESEKTLCTLSDFGECESKEHIELMRERLHFVEDLSVKNFNTYYARLETFFRLFD